MALHTILSIEKGEETFPYLYLLLLILFLFLCLFSNGLQYSDKEFALDKLDDLYEVVK